MTTKQFTSDLKLKAINYYHKINRGLNILSNKYLIYFELIERKSF